MSEGFNIEDVKAHLKKFLEYVGYKLKNEEYVGFVKPDIHAERIEAGGRKRYEIVCVVRKGLEAGEDSVISGFRDVCAAKCVLGDKVDYILALPPTSERLMIAFLIEEKEWYFPIKEQGLIIWLVNPKRETVNSIIGCTTDETFKDFFEKPDIVTFDAFIGRWAAQKIMEEEEEF